MKITVDPAERTDTLRDRDLDFADAGKVFAGATVDREDDRFNYGEARLLLVGMLNGAAVATAWTDRGRRPPYDLDA